MKKTPSYAMSEKIGNLAADLKAVFTQSYSDGVYEENPLIRDEREGRQILRPSIPPLAVCAVAYWGGIAAAEALTWGLFCGSIEGDARWVCLIFGLFFALSMAVLLVFLRCEKSTALLRLSTACLLGVFVGCCFWTQWESRTQSYIGEGGAHRIEIVADVQEGDYGYNSDARYWTSDGSVLPITVYWSHEEDIAAAGESFWSFGTVSLPSSEEARRAAHMNARYGSLSVYAVRDKTWAADMRGFLGPARQRIRLAMQAIEGEGSALMQGIILGDRGKLANSEIKQSFQICGLSHLIAVSGTHLVVVCALINCCLGLLPLGPKTRATLLFAAVLCYLVMSGIQISAVRAALMLGAGLLGQVLGRKKNSLTACALCCIAVLSITPSAALSVSFVLSVSAVFGIVIFSSYVESWLICLTAGRFRTLLKALALTLVAQAATLPITAPLFAALPLLSPVANILVAPLVSALLAFGLLAGLLCLLIPQIGYILLEIDAALGNFIADLAHRLAQIPHASVALSLGGLAFVLACVGALLALWITWPRPTKRRAFGFLAAACSVCLVCIAVSLLPSSPQLIMLNVGQGDAIVLRDSHKSLLIDTGEADAGLTRALAKNNVHALDAVLISHLHSDHYAALPSLKALIPTSTVFFSASVQEEAYASSEAVCMARALVGNDKIAYLEVGDSINLGHFTLEVISPKAFTDEGGNADSLCLLLLYDAQGDGVPESKALFVGDAEKDTLIPLIQSGALGQVDLLKVGHHGSEASLDRKTLEVLDPALALISVGAGNKYGHPNTQTVNVLREQGAAVYRTDQSGDITVNFCKDGLRLACDAMPADEWQ